MTNPGKWPFFWENGPSLIDYWSLKLELRMLTCNWSFFLKKVFYETELETHFLRVLDFDPNMGFEIVSQR